MHRDFLAWIFSVAGYFIKSLLRTSNSFWVEEIPSVKESIEYLFGRGVLGWVCFILFLLSAIAFFLKEKGVVHLKNGEGEEKIVVLGWRQGQFSAEAVLILSAIFIIVIFFLFLEIFSYAVRPVYLVWYLYPAAGIVWLAAALAVTRADKRKVLALCFLILMLVNFVPKSLEQYKKDAVTDRKCNETVAYVRDTIDDNTILVSDIGMLYSRFFTLYFEGTRLSALHHLQMDSVEDNQRVYLFLEKEMTEELEEIIYENGLKIVERKEGVYVGKYPAELYILSR